MASSASSRPGNNTNFDPNSDKIDQNQSYYGRVSDYTAYLLNATSSNRTHTQDRVNNTQVRVNFDPNQTQNHTPLAQPRPGRRALSPRALEFALGIHQGLINSNNMTNDSSVVVDEGHAEHIDEVEDVDQVENIDHAHSPFYPNSSQTNPQPQHRPTPNFYENLLRSVLNSQETQNNNMRSFFDQKLNESNVQLQNDSKLGRIKVLTDLRKSPPPPFDFDTGDVFSHFSSQFEPFLEDRSLNRSELIKAIGLMFVNSLHFRKQAEEIATLLLPQNPSTFSDRVSTYKRIRDTIELFPVQNTTPKSSTETFIDTFNRLFTTCQDEMARDPDHCARIVLDQMTDSSTKILSECDRISLEKAWYNFKIVTPVQLVTKRTILDLLHKFVLMHKDCLTNLNIVKKQDSPHVAEATEKCKICILMHKDDPNTVFHTTKEHQFSDRDISCSFAAVTEYDSDDSECVDTQSTN